LIQDKADTTCPIPDKENIMNIRRQVEIVSLSLSLLITTLSITPAYSAEQPEELAAATSKHPSLIPQPRIAEWWFARQAEKIGLMSKGEFDLLMVGDSITNNYENEKVGLKVWEKYFVPLKAINLGFGGDRTEHVLWRLEHLPVLKKAPKGAVLLIGTNNICWGSDTPKQAAEGVQAVAGKLKEIYPDTKVLVLGVLPRRRNLDHPHRKQINELNSYLPELLKDMKGVSFRDIGPAFLDEKGFLSEEMMPDTTHPSEKGHEVWAKAIAPDLKEMLGE
jgi:lysophospholipase L1-like esterase